MTKPILVANWKNHPGSMAEVQALLTDLSRKSRFYKKLSLFIAPPLTYYDIVSKRASAYGKLSSQNLSFVTTGTKTGEVGIDIVKSFGVKLAIIGHSDRRSLGETSHDVSEKVKIALKASIVPLICVGENMRDSDGEYFEFIREQIKSSLAGLTPKNAGSIVLAYEPVWAIGGSGKDVLPPEELTQTILFIKKVLTDLFGRKVADKIPVLYGAAVDPENATLLYRETGIKGFLVGRASLKSKSLEAIANALL